jgi:hypothetical protein
VFPTSYETTAASIARLRPVMNRSVLYDSRVKNWVMVQSDRARQQRSCSSDQPYPLSSFEIFSAVFSAIAAMVSEGLAVP